MPEYKTRDEMIAAIAKMLSKEDWKSIRTLYLFLVSVIGE